MYNEGNDTNIQRTKKYWDKSNFGPSGSPARDRAEEMGDRRSSAPQKKYQADPYASPLKEEAARRREYAQQRYNEASARRPQAQPAKEEAIEGYDPADLADYDEFGRPRRKAQEIDKSKAQHRRREALGWILSIVIAVAAAILVRTFVFEIILVDGESMYPTLYTNERVAIEKVTRYGGMPERGDIIIVEYPGMTGTYVKRAIGLPGDTVEVKDSTVYINGQPLSEDYVNPEPYADMAPVTVPEEHVFVMGDNRAHSLDSRTEYIGPISHDAILGHGLFVIWPFDNIHKIS